MSENLMIGIAVMMLCLIIQCLVSGLLLFVFLRMERKQRIRPTFKSLFLVLIVVMLIMLFGNILQMTIWAGLFFVLGEFVDFATAVYHSVVNFATLGYGDLVMSEKRRLLGALEATNGVLMFGLTASTIFMVLNGMLRRAWDEIRDEG